MKNKVLFVIWVILLVAIFAVLSILGFIHKNNVNNYHEYEDKLVVAARRYVNANKIYPKKGSKITINVVDLISENFIDKRDIVKECDGKIIVKYEQFIDYIPDLKCKYYSSKTK